MRAIPELGTALQSYRPQNTDNANRLAVALRDMFSGMDRTTDGFIPLSFLAVSRLATYDESR